MARKLGNRRAMGKVFSAKCKGSARRVRLRGDERFGGLWGAATRGALEKVREAHRGATDPRGELLCRTAGELFQQMVDEATV